MILLFTSAKGGVGKSTISVNIAHELSKNKKVLLFDADIGSSVDHIFFGRYQNNTIQEFCDGSLPFESIKLKLTNNLDLISSPNGFWDLSGENLQKIKNLLKLQNYVYDYIVIDTHPGVMTTNLELMKISDNVYIIVNSEEQSIIDNYALIKYVQKEKITAETYLITNKISDNRYIDIIKNNMNIVLKKNGYNEIKFAGNINMSTNVANSVKDKKIFMQHFEHTAIANQFRDLIKSTVIKKVR